MENTIGKRISALRRDKGLRQDDLAEKMQVSPQAVSKWENDQTCPDISALPQLAEVLGVTVDELLTGKKEEKTVEVVAFDEKKDEAKRVIHIECGDGGDKVRLNLPLELIQTAFDLGISLPDISGKDVLKNIDLKNILALADRGVVGNLLEIDSEDGAYVKIYID